LESRDVTHLQFTGWPDYGVPHSAAAFLDFMFLVRQKQQQRLLEVNSKQIDGNPGGPPVVIHCSAGIGRTGCPTNQLLIFFSFILFLLLLAMRLVM